MVIFRLQSYPIYDQITIIIVMKERFQKQRRIKLDKVTTYFEMGCYFISVEDYDQAITSLTKATESDADLAGAYCKRGECYYKLGIYDKAVLDINRAIELNPEAGVYYSNRGFAYHDMKKYIEAIVNFNKAIRLGYKTREIYAKRGDAYAELGRFKKSEDDYKQVALVDFLTDLLGNKVVLLADESA
jgi:tetratricopeptide (TPR) repeat protein